MTPAPNSGGNNNTNSISTHPSPSPMPQSNTTTTPQPNITAPQPQPEVFFHARFILGYPDGSFRPHGHITRAETAALLVRTMTTHFGVDVNRQAQNRANFSDVDVHAWYYDYIAIACEYGIIQGFPDGSFKPNSPITREQFAGMLARTTTVITGGSLPYSDAAYVSPWAHDYVYTALVEGLMHGDETGTFRPKDSITRAEATTGINRILGRGDTTARSVELVSNLIIFPDVSDNVWFYYHVLEATNSHRFVMDGYEEIWIDVVND